MQRDHPYAHRGRGRLHPHRRGAHAADHQRPAPRTAASTYHQFARVASGSRRDEDYEVDEKRKTVAPTEEGVAQGREAGSASTTCTRPATGRLVNHFIQALKAESLYKRDVEYVVTERRGEDRRRVHRPHHGGRRWSEGLHQAVEAKEGVKIEAENNTVATITIQNYFRMYESSPA